MFRVITSGHVTDRDYLEMLHELHRKLNIIDVHANRDVHSTKDVQIEADTLKLTVRILRPF